MMTTIPSVPSVSSVCFTGHRPKGLFGYDELAPGNVWLKDALLSVIQAFQAKGCTHFISGMALGVDTWAAEAVIEAGGFLDAYVPFEGQEGRWPASSQARYRDLLGAASDVHYTVKGHPGGYDGVREALLQRNRDMLQDTEAIIAVWSGVQSGGTFHAVSAAKRMGRPIVHIDPFKRTIRVLS